MKIGDVILRENFAPTFFKPVPNALAREDACECKKFRVVRLAAAVEVSTQHSQLPSLILTLMIAEHNASILVHLRLHGGAAWGIPGGWGDAHETVQKQG